MKRKVRTRLKIIHKEDEWISVHMPCMYLTCCDCGLTHRLKFLIIRDGKGIAMRISSAAGKTRKHRKKGSCFYPNKFVPRVKVKRRG